MGLTLTDFKTGISWWLSEDRWPHDFHNTAYYELYDLRRNGLSDDWWGKTVDRLWDWRAIRPYTKAEIKKRGRRYLTDIQRIYLDMCGQTEDEPVFLNFKWDQIRGLYEVLAKIKASKTPVFPSKLGHFIFPKLFVVMDHKATGTEDYEVFWGLMHKEWNNFVEREEAKKILSEEIAKHSAKKVHMQYPFEIKIIELCNIGKKQNKPHQTISMDGQVTPLILTARQCPRERGVTMKGLNEDFSCEFCRFSIKTLIEMAEIGGRKEMFSTFKRLDNLMNIYEVNTESGYIVMRRSTGRFTDELSIDALIQVHNLVHTGKIYLDPHEIDSNKETYKWGNYIASLLRHLGCQKFV